MTKIQKRRLRAAKRMHARVARFAKSRTKCPELRAIAVTAAGSDEYSASIETVRTATVRSLMRYVHDAVFNDAKKVGQIPGCGWVIKRAKHLAKLRYCSSMLRVPVKFDDNFYPF